MRTSIKTLGLLLFYCLSVACNSQETSINSNLTSSELKKDYEIFQKALEEAHPALYKYTSKAEFEKAFEEVGENLNRNLTKKDFFKGLTPLITKIRCGHVKFMVGGEEPYKFPFHEDQLFPLKLLISENAVFVHKNYGNSKISPGSKILEIENKPISRVIDSLLPYVSFADGKATASKYRELSDYFSGYYAAFINTKPSYNITYLSPEGVEGTAELLPVTYKQIQQEEEGRSSGKQEELLELKIWDETAVLKIGSFWFDDKSLNFEAFLKNSFKTIQEKEVKSLIIDLRGNEGGKDSYGALLYSYLTDTTFNYYSRISTNSNKKFSFSEYSKQPWYFFLYRQLLKKSDDGRYLWKRHDNLKVQKPQAEPFLGKVIILINGRSFSVTSEFAAVAYSNQRATFIGQETAGGYLGNNSGFFSIITLPNSGFVLGIPLWHYELAVNPDIMKEGGVIPHYPVELQIEDILNGVDREMEVAMDLVSKKNL